MNSESELDGKQLNLLSGDQLTFNSKKGIYTYLTNIKYTSNDRVGIFKVDLSNSLKCISATLGCENLGLDLVEINSKKPTLVGFFIYPSKISSSNSSLGAKK